MTRLARTSLLGLTLTLAPIFASAQEPEASTSDSQNGAVRLLEAAVEAGHFAGVMAGFSKGTDNRWAGSAGHCDMAAKTACSATTPIRIASITKPMTAVAIIQLHERGLLDLDAPIAKYLSNYPAKAASNITTRHLLHHTAGIGGYASSKESETVKEYATLADAARVFQDRELLFQPGQSYQYTTYGYVVLGLIIESVSGQTYEEYLRENIWDKAAMGNTGVEHFGAFPPKGSKLYLRTKKGRIKTAKANNLSNRVPGGGVYSTVEDMLRFGRAVLDGTLVTESSLAAMRTYPDVDRGKNNPYGMGWFVYQEDPERGLIFGHGGEQTGASGQLMLMPQKDLVVVVLSNTGRAGRAAIELSVQLIEHSLRAE